MIYAAVMSKRCKVVKPVIECQSSSAEPDSINCELCFLCQEEKDDHLQRPINAKGHKCGLHSAIYHKSCYLKYTSSKVQRLLKRSVEASDTASRPKKTRSQLNVQHVNRYRVYPSVFFVMNLVGNCTRPALQKLILMLGNVPLN